MGDLGPEKSHEANNVGADLGHTGTGLDNQSSLHDKLSADSTPGKSTQIDLTQAKNSATDNQFLPAFDTQALWSQAGSADNTGSGAGKSISGSWSDRYAANFDRSDEDKAAQKLDMSNAIGLPRGTSKEELLRAAHRQEEDLLSQLLEA